MNNVSITAEKLALQPIVLSPITCYVLFANLAKVKKKAQFLLIFALKLKSCLILMKIHVLS